MSNEAPQTQTPPPAAPKADEKALATTTYDRGTKLIPRDLGEAKDIAAFLSKSDAIPKEFIGKPANILLAIMHGSEVGLSPAQSLSSIMVVNGRATMWGDALLALVMASKVYGGHKKWFTGEGDNLVAHFKAWRKGCEADAVEDTFSWADAVKAGLTARDLYKKYPKRMLGARVSTYGLRDLFPDVLKGIVGREELEDVIETTTVQDAGGKSPAEMIREQVNEPKPQTENITDAEVVTPKETPTAETSKPEPTTQPPAAAKEAAPVPAAAPAKRRGRF